MEYGQATKQHPLITTRRPSVQHSPTDNQSFRILSLDGGGIRDAFTAAFLARLELELGRSVTDYFDLVVGTSTGGIIALALGLGEPASRISAFYKERGSAIFTCREDEGGTCMQRIGWQLTKWVFPSLANKTLIRSKYPADELRAALEEVYKDRILEEVKACRIVIPAVDLIRGMTVTFKTPHQPNFIRDRKLKAVDVALATSAAPTYFPQASIGDGEAFSDGGLWANNPAIVGYIEAMKISHVCHRPQIDRPFNPSDISMLSIGTGRPQYYARPEATDDGLLWWGSKLFDVSGGAQSQGADFQAQYLMGARYRRIDFDMPNEPWPLDEVRALPQLLHRGEQEAISRYAELRPIFFTAIKAPYVPFE